MQMKRCSVSSTEAIEGDGESAAAVLPSADETVSLMQPDVTLPEDTSSTMGEGPTKPHLL